MYQSRNAQHEPIFVGGVVTVVGFCLLLLLVVPTTSYGQLQSGAQRATAVQELNRRFPGASRRALDEHVLIERLLASSARIDSAEFDGVVHAISANAVISANSCGNVNEYPHQLSFSMPNTSPMTAPLDRLDYSLTEEERRTTEGRFWSGIPYIAEISGKIRTKAIRACIEHWSAVDWIGSIVDGHLEVWIRLETSQLTATVPNSWPKTTPLVKTRRINEYKYDSAPRVGPLAGVVGWIDQWDWDHPGADITIKDLHNGWSYLIVQLKPELEGNRFTYVVTDVSWLSNPPGGFFMGSHVSTALFPDTDLGLFNQLPSLRERILTFNTTKKESIRQFVSQIFNSSSVKSRVTGALIEKVRSKIPAGATLTRLFVSGDHITFSYSLP